MRILKIRAYIDQEPRWPSDGRVILAQYDESTILVYQAFSAGIARYAVEKQRFGGGHGWHEQVARGFPQTRDTWSSSLKRCPRQDLYCCHPGR